MISRVLPSFKKAFRALPKEIKHKAKESYKRWKKNPFDKSLRFKRVHPSKPVYSVRITLNWRALGIMEGKNTITWFWIGSHEQYSKLKNSIFNDKIEIDTEKIKIDLDKFSTTYGLTPLIYDTFFFYYCKIGDQTQAISHSKFINHYDYFWYLYKSHFHHHLKERFPW